MLGPEPVGEGRCFGADAGFSFTSVPPGAVLRLDQVHRAGPSGRARMEDLRCILRCPAGQLRRLHRWRVSGRLAAATNHERRNELFSIEAEARPNHWAVFTLGCRAILAPITYSFQIGFGLASQGIDPKPLPSLRSDGF